MAGVNITFARDAVHKLLSRVADATPSKNTIPLLSHILVEHGDHGMRFTCTDMDVWLSVDVPAQGQRFRAFCVPGRLAAIVAALPDGSQVNLVTPKDAAADDATSIHVVAGRSRFSLPILPADEFPKPPQPGDVEFQSAAGSLHDMLARTSWAAGSEETRYYLNGVFIHYRAQHMRAVATDGNRLGKCDGTDPEGASAIADLEQGGIILPNRAVDILGHMLDDSDATVEIALSNEAFGAMLEPWTFVTKLVDGTFPDYEKVFPADLDALCGVDIDAGALKSALARVALVTTDKSHGVRVFGAKGLLSLEATGADGAQAREEIDAAWHRKPPADPIGFNSKYLKQAIDGLGAVTLTLMLGSGEGPTLVKVPGRDGLVALIMPMRV